MANIRTKDISVAYPATPAARLELMMGAPGNISVTPGTGDDFVHGKIEYDRVKWTPEIEIQDDLVRLVQAERWEDRPAFESGQVNRWQLQLGDKKQFSLSVRSSVGNGEWQLGGLPLTELRFTTGVSRSTIGFDKPNPQVMTDFTLQVGVNQVTVNGLANANFKEMYIEGGVGDIVLNLTGRGLQQDAHISFHGGVGKFSLTVADGLPVSVKVTGMTSIRAAGSFKKSDIDERHGWLSGLPFGGTYTTAGFTATASPKLTVDVTTGVGEINLNSISV